MNETMCCVYKPKPQTSKEQKTDGKTRVSQYKQRVICDKQIISGLMVNAVGEHCQQLKH